MSILAGLHTHTTASDVQHTPTELVRLAKEHSLQILAVTGHDTIAGADEAMSAGEKLDLRVICGVDRKQLSPVAVPTAP